MNSLPIIEFVGRKRTIRMKKKQRFQASAGHAAIGCVHHQNLGRRDFLRIGSLSAGVMGLGLADGFGLADWLKIRRLQAEQTGSVIRAGTQANIPEAKAKSCILIWLDGGPSHLETFDPKPDAPAEVRGPLETIGTTIPGIRLGECLPHTAKVMEHVALIRSVTSPLGEHQFGTHYMMTGYKPTPVLDYPTFGAVCSHLTDGSSVLPTNIAVPHFKVGGAGMTGQGFLPAHHQPFSSGGDPAKPNFQVRDLDYFPGVTGNRIDRRMKFIQAMNGFRTVGGQTEYSTADGADLGKAADVVDRVASSSSADPDLKRAFELMRSDDAKAAFDLRQESDSVRSSYGRKTIGQSCLVARRLVERGVPFVTVNHKGWDTHSQLVTRLKDGFAGSKTPLGLVPSLDQALGSLIEDLNQRGMLEETLVLVMGEFGRTPKLNISAGRDHWPRVFSVLMAGGGVRGGQVIGRSDAIGESPSDRAVTPSDLAASTYTLLGIDPATELQTPDGRPVRLTPRDSKMISELI